MQFDRAALMQAVRQTVVAPREVARQIIAMELPATVGWIGLALAVVLSALLAVISLNLAYSTADLDAYGMLFASPIRLAVLQGLAMIISLALIMGIGRGLGGQGRFSDALVLMAWLEAVLMMIQVAQMVLRLVSEPLADLLGLASFAVFLWVLSNFVAELHGFKSGAKVLGTILLTFFVISVVMALFGIGLPAGGAENV